MVGNGFKSIEMHAPDVKYSVVSFSWRVSADEYVQTCWIHL